MERGTFINISVMIITMVYLHSSFSIPTIVFMYNVKCTFISVDVYHFS